MSKLCDDCAHECRNCCAFLRDNEQPYFQAYRWAFRQHGELKAGFEFMSWIGGKWAAWRALRGLQPYAPITEDQRADFGQWLRQAVDFPEAA